MSNNQSSMWICCQLGAREHYSIPRALQQSGQLLHLITDAWVRPHSLIQKLPTNTFKSLGDRHHPELATASVHAFTNQLILFEAQQRFLKTQTWERMIARNNWFQKQVIHRLKGLNSSLSKLEKTPILFTYSYAALEILKYAKAQGWRTILGQIDPGIEEEKIVLEEFKNHPSLAPNWRSVPTKYWQNWQQECELADHILVNSQWSKKLLVGANIIDTKIKVIPLIYQPSQAAIQFKRIYPEKFSGDRPLRILFLGLITLRKGIAAYLEAIPYFFEKPVEFWFIGSLQIQIPEHLYNHPQIHWLGSVPRSQTDWYYQNADIFLFPTLSDGFGLTQLEAAAWKLPIIKSKNCGEIENDMAYQIILSEVSASSIIAAILSCLEAGKLSTIAQKLNAIKFPQYSLQSLAAELSQIEIE